MVKTIGAVVFDGFELLDLYGPLEMFGMLPEQFSISLVAETAEPVQSGQGPRCVVDATFADHPPFDLLLVPGGPGTRDEVSNEPLLAWLANASQRSELVMSVCTGSALLACAGLLDNRRATTNKLAFDWVRNMRPDVDWIARARWVEDDRFLTSSGVSAGMDMSLAAIERLLGADAARDVALWAEYERHLDPHHDPFAEAAGLV